MDLIDREALADALFEKRKNYPQWVAEAIVNLPEVDAVAVVRCKDCIWFHKPDSRNDGWTKRCTLRFGGIIKLTKDKYRPKWCPLMKQESR